MSTFWDKNNDEKLKETKVDSSSVFDGALLHVHKDTVSLSNGNHTTREFITHPGASCIVPLTDDGKVIVERQFRYPFNSVLTEIPAGKRDEGEDFLKAAKRELLEETGLVADRWTDMGAFYPSCAYSDEVIEMYLAQGLHFGKQHLDDDEFVDLYKIPLKELVDDVMSGKITDGKTQTALLKAYCLV